MRVAEKTWINDKPRTLRTMRRITQVGLMSECSCHIMYSSSIPNGSSNSVMQDER